MNSFMLAWAAIKNRPLNSCLNILSFAAGVALLVTVFLLFNNVQKGMDRNAQGIDVLVGAKGSPVQLVLSSIYHSDIPNGNIEMKNFDRIAHNPQVREAIPVAIGDSYKGFRVVGTTPAYLDHFNAEYAKGRAFTVPFEVVAGAATGLKIGDEFAAVHGFATDGDDVHHFHNYKVVGVLRPSGTVIDRLLVTPFQSVQTLHSHPDADDPDAAEELKLGHQITSILIKVKSPIAVMNLPREINKSSDLLAVSPSFQMARLSKNLGMGKDLLAAIAVGVVCLSTLLLLSGLINSLSARKYDLAVLRVMGAGRSKLFATVITEGMILTIAGCVAGIVLGHISAYAIAHYVPSLQGIVLPRAFLYATSLDAFLLILSVGIGLIGSVIPAMLARKTDISIILSKGRL